MRDRNNIDALLVENTNESNFPGHTGRLAASTRHAAASPEHMPVGERLASKPIFGKSKTASSTLYRRPMHAFRAW